jgi:trehalose 6-phosphate phosphatase
VDDLPPVVAAVREGLARAALFLDFDGSLAPIVADPADAEPLPSAVAAMAALAERCQTVAVVSGRPVAFLDAWFPPVVRLAGLYGLEQRVDGRTSRQPEAQRWEQVVAAAAAGAAALPAPVRAENKGLSLTLHYRAAPDLGPLVAAWADEEARRSGLVARSAKMSVELHPPVPLDKGDVVRSWSDGAGVVVVAGDDAGDLPAFAALGPLASAGVVTLGVAVLGAETPAAVRSAADLLVEGPPGLADLLISLAGTS